MLKVLYKDADFVAVDKPSGLLVHRTSLSTDRHCCLQLLRDQLGQWVYPLHRLDRATSGVLLFALNPEAAAAASEKFREKGMRKQYLALVRGQIDSEGTIDRPLKRNPENKQSELLEARTRYRRLKLGEVNAPVGRYPTARYSLVEVETDTGRLHQIRRHMSSISHPLVGDTVYGDGKHNRLFRELFGIHRLMLCAKSLEFSHPSTHCVISIVAESVEEFIASLNRVQWL